jgi:hypothetical protein
MPLQEILCLHDVVATSEKEPGDIERGYRVDVVLSTRVYVVAMSARDVALGRPYDIVTTSGIRRRIIVWRRPI